jgi:hypothetical protein
VRIGVGQSGPLRSLRQTQVLEFSQTALQAIGNLTQRPSLRQLTEHHGHKLLPATETFGSILAFDRADVAVKIIPIE